MDASILSFCKSLAAFCSHVESSSKALCDSVQRRPIPLDSAASAFLKSMERRISSTNDDLNLLHSMAFDTVSFEELLGHCNEVYKVNDQYIAQVEERMRSFGYVPEVVLVEEEDDAFRVDAKHSSTSTTSVMHPVEDELFNSISLKNLGLSEVSLAALASENQEFSANTKFISQEVTSYSDYKQRGNSLLIESTTESSNPTGRASTEIKISEDNYDKLPAFMKSLSSWEELQEAVHKINTYVSGIDGSNGDYTLDQSVLEMLDLGKKGRSYLLLLLRMNQLSAETVNGSILFQVRRHK